MNSQGKPLGVMPENLWLQQRMHDLARAILEYSSQTSHELAGNPGDLAKWAAEFERHAARVAEYAAEEWPEIAGRPRFPSPPPAAGEPEVYARLRTINAHALLLSVAIQLDQWAFESRQGGWSTHQVKPQRDLAAKIKQFLVEAAP